MATSINLEHVLHGQLLALSKHDLLVESPDKFVPRTKLNVGYIVSAVIINEAGKILLVQEAKRSCRGLWLVLSCIHCNPISVFDNNFLHTVVASCISTGTI